MTMIMKLLGKLIAIPVIMVLGATWLLVKCTVAILNIAHGFIWLFMGILAIFAVVSHMWIQLAQIVGWGMFSLVILTLGVGIEMFLEQTSGRLLGFVCRA